MSIQVRIQNVYGNETIYPVCDKAKIFAAMFNQKTLTLEDINQIKKLGYSVEVVTERKNL